MYLGVVLYVLRGAKSYDSRAKAIYDMRTYIRSKFHDVRTRGDVIKALFQFIDGLDDEQYYAEPSTSGMFTNSGRQTGRKRAARARDDDDDEEDDDGSEYGARKATKPRVRSTASSSTRQTQKATRGRRPAR